MSMSVGSISSSQTGSINNNNSGTNSIKPQAQIAFGKKSSDDSVEIKKEASTAKKWGVGLAGGFVGNLVNGKVGTAFGFLGALIGTSAVTLCGVLLKNIPLCNIGSIASLGVFIAGIVSAVKNVKPDMD